MKIKTTDMPKFPVGKGATDAPVCTNTVDRKSSISHANKSNLAVAAINVVPPPSPSEEACPFRRLLREWLTAGRANGLSKETLEDYSDKLHKFWWWWTEGSHLADKLGGPHPKNLTVKEARQFAAYLREPQAFRWGISKPTNNKQRYELSPASIASYGRTVKAFFNWLEAEGYIEQTPFNKSVKFSTRKQDRVIKRVETADLERIFATLSRPEVAGTFLGSRNLAMISLMLDTGIRRGELLALRLSDVELDHNRCTVAGKTTRRYASLSRLSKEALTRYLQHPEYPAKAGPGPGLSSPEQTALWLTADGLPLSSHGFATVIRKIKKDSGVAFHAHRLRHTFATLMAQRVNLFDLKELMGHSSVKTTEIYVQQNPDHLAEVHRQNSPLTTLQLGQPVVKRKRGRPPKEK